MQEYLCSIRNLPSNKCGSECSYFIHLDRGSVDGTYSFNNLPHSLP